MTPSPARLAALTMLVTATALAAPEGWYRHPAVHGDTIVFTAEGDLWTVPIAGGVARRLTSHLGEEGRAAFSPDGTTLAFTAVYEGPAEVYTMPVAGGLPVRRTWEGQAARVIGWTPRGRVLYTTRARSGLPDWQLATLDLADARRELVPLAQASDGAWDAEEKRLFFVRHAFQGSHTKRYQGGKVQNLWRWSPGAEAVQLAGDFAGTSKDPMWLEAGASSRLYFLSDRDGTMNVWSMRPDGTDLRQHTKHVGWDAASASLGPGKNGARIVYQLGGDLRLLDLASGEDRRVPIELATDLDQMRERWVEKPLEWLSAAHLSPDGKRVALTARGRVWVAPVGPGRLVEATREPGVRWREARFMPSGAELVGLSDRSGEVEVWTTPANGVGDPVQRTKGATVLRWEAIPSPDGKWIAHSDKDQRLWLTPAGGGDDVRVDPDAPGRFQDLAWSPDSRWLAYAVAAKNLNLQVKLCRVADRRTFTLTTDRQESWCPAWSPDGKWLYLLSDRNLESIVGSPWGTLQPEPFFDRRTKVYHVALKQDERSPWAAPDELHPDDAKEEEKEEAKTGDEKEGQTKEEEEQVPEVVIELEGIAERLEPVPVEPGNYHRLLVAADRLFLVESEPGAKDEPRLSLHRVVIAREDPKREMLLEEVKEVELSHDGTKLLVQLEEALHVLDAASDAPADLEETAVDLSGWRVSIQPREEWRQMFREAWRLERDYFYDRAMHGVDWAAIRAKYEPLVERVATRAELSDLIAQMVAELSALHTFVSSGDAREGDTDVGVASLGARLVRDERAGGVRVEHVYRSDPDQPELRAPLSRPGVRVVAGDLIERIDGAPALSVPDPAVLLRDKAGKQVLLHVKPAAGGETRQVIATPISADQESALRYHEWEYTRRLKVEELGQGRLGYVHLQAMGAEDMAEWARQYYPVFDRQGLIIDVRHNGGGNIDSWLLSRLLRRAWFTWSDRVGQPPTWNMQYAFRGHMVVLIDASTGSDGEAFAEGFRRLGLGKLIGTRTWGGEIWLSGDNLLVDKGVATAAEYGVFGPEGSWLIEGHGVDPDFVVDNLPAATFQGKDAQLEAAVEHLESLLRERPVPPLTTPKMPNKAFPKGQRPEGPPR